MRKITLNPKIGSSGSAVFDLENNWIVVKDDSGAKEFKGVKTVFNEHKYTAHQLNVIHDVNSVLKQNDQEILNEQEQEYLIYPWGREERIGTEDLQALAGFRVEKTITPV